MLRGGRLWIVAALCLLDGSLPAWAQVRVTGRVTNQNNLPIDGARITMQNTPPTAKWEAISDATGFFALQLPSPGVYSLRVDRDGFYVVTQPEIPVPANVPGAPPFDLHIPLESIHEIKATVEVKGEVGLADMDRVTPQTTLSSRTFYDVPFPNPNSLRSALRTIPGLIQDPTGGIHLFGGSEDQAQYSFEGFQLNDPLTGDFDARMSLESVESVDVQPSPSDADMGRGDAGTMLLRARTGSDDFQFSAVEFFPGIALGAGPRLSSWTPRAYFSGPWKKRRAWFFNTAELQFLRDTIKQLPVDQDASVSWRFNDLLHNQINLTGRNIVFIGLLWDYQYSPHSGLTPLDPFDTTLRRESGQWFGYVKDQWTFSATSLLEFGFATDMEHSAAIPHGDAPYLITPDGRGGDYYADARRDAHRSQAVANYYFPALHLFGEHQFKTGGDIIHIDYRQNITRTSIDYLDPSGDVIRAVSFLGSGALSRANDVGSAYFQDSWRVRPWLMLEAGWRADGDVLVGRVNSSPRAGFGISPPGMANLRFSGSFARIVDATSLQLFTRPLDQSAVSAYYDPAGNLLYGPVTTIFTPGTNLQSPRADVWTLGADRSFPKLLRGKIQLLRRRYTDGFDYTNSLPAEDQLPAILAGAPNPGPIVANYVLTNQRQDHYESAEISFGQPLNGRFQWIVSYTRSRAESNAVIDRSVDQPLTVASDTGPLPWDAPNRLLSWGYLPTWNKNWAVGYMLDWHTGLPFSAVDDYGQLVGTVDAQRFPTFFELNVFLERLLTVRGYRFAVRGGLNNITAHFNPTIVNNVTGTPLYLSEYNGQPRALNFALRLLDKK